MTFKIRIGNISKVPDNNIRICNRRLHIYFFIIPCNWMDCIGVWVFSVFHLNYLFKSRSNLQKYNTKCRAKKQSRDYPLPLPIKAHFQRPLAVYFNARGLAFSMRGNKKRSAFISENTSFGPSVEIRTRGRPAALRRYGLCRLFQCKRPRVLDAGEQKKKCLHF